MNMSRTKRIEDETLKQIRNSLKTEWSRIPTSREIQKALEQDRGITMDESTIRGRFIAMGEPLSGTQSLDASNLPSTEPQKETTPEFQIKKREVKEEAGIDVKIISGFKEKIKFFYKNEGKLIYKEVTFFLAEARQSEVKISVEHNDYKWATYKEALKLLTFKNSKEILKRANEFLQKFKQKNIKDFL